MRSSNYYVSRTSWLEAAHRADITNNPRRTCPRVPGNQEPPSPPVSSLKDRRQESMAGPKSEEWHYPENDDVARPGMWQLAGR